MALKIDIRKAFDTMYWDFLLFVLECLGFQEHFRSMIRSILHSTRLFISVNGSLEGYFSCSRGVRQGDPLSPLLFAIGEEVLARLIKDGGENRVSRAVAKLGVEVPSSLFYADDIMLFCQATRNNVYQIRDILDLYGEILR